MATSGPTIALPGQLLGPASQYTPGPGTHLHETNLYSSLLGTVNISQPSKSTGPAKRLNKITPTQPAELPTISVSRTNISEKREVLPEVNNVVLCRVTRIASRQAVVAILVVGETVLEAEWQGVIRVQDVRATEKDRVKIHESFRPGDIVRAQVVSLGPALVVEDTRGAGTGMLTRLRRFRWATRPTTTSRRPRTSWASSWRRARRATPCSP